MRALRTALGIAVAGGLGSLARYGLGAFITRRHPGEFPWGTFAVNVLGAFAMGLIFTLATEKWQLAPWLRLSLTVGFLGGFTTFSTMAFEGYRLSADDLPGLTALYLVGSIALGLVAVYGGILTARAL